MALFLGGLGYHLGPSILMLACDWLGVYHLDYTCSFHAFSVQIRQHLWNSLDIRLILVLACAFYSIFMQDLMIKIGL
jgi:hypothetical protein